MLKKFLAFLGLSSIDVKDGKATVTMTEEQMEASGKIIDERDQAKADAEKYKAERDEAKKELADEKSKVSALEDENKTLKEENKVLKSQPAEESTEVVTESNSVEKKEANGCVTSEKNDFLTNVLKTKEAYL